MREYIELKLGNPALTRVLIVTSDPVNIESQNQAQNIPVALSSYPIKIWVKSVQWFLSYDRTNKQTRDYNFLYIEMHETNNRVFLFSQGLI